MDAAECEGLKARETGLEGTDWCLYLEGIEVGYEYSGTVTPTGEAERTALAITLTARHNFLVWPAVVSLLGVALAVGWAVWTGVKLKDLVSSNLLKATLARNRRDADQSLVDDLEDKVASLREIGKSSDELRSMVLAILGVGLRRAAASRSKLGQAIAEFGRQHAGWNDTPLVRTARDIQNRKDRFSDFYNDAGVPVEVHPADAWRTNLGTVQGLLVELTLVRREIVGNPGLEREANLVEQALRDAEDDAGINRAREHLGRLWDDAFGPRAAATAAVAPAARAEAPEVPLVPRGAWLPLAKIGLGLLVTVFGLALIAVAGLLSATYASNHTFGTGWDYLGLFLAAFGSSAVAGIVGALALTAVAKPK